MRTRTIAAVIAALLILPAAYAFAQWDIPGYMPRRNNNAPSRRSPLQHPSYRAHRGPIQHQKAATRGPLIRHPVSPRVSGNMYGNVYNEWARDSRAPSVEYNAYDTAISDANRGYNRTPGVGE